jgi:hypothetical protein
LIKLARASGEEVKIMTDFMPGQTNLNVECLTEEEIHQGLQAMRNARQLRERVRRERDRNSLSDSIELIREMREKRSEHLEDL